MSEPVIVFNGYEIQHYRFERKKQNNVEQKKEDPLSVSVESGTTDDLEHGRISIQVLYDLPEVAIDIKVSGYFDINVAEKPEKISEYLVVNGTAIVFPYVRSMVSMLSSLDSENSIILPTINTTNFLEKS